MAEPATTAAVSTIMAGASIASLLPFIHADALIGSAFGAAVITFYASNSLWHQRIIGLFLSIIGGYIFGGYLGKFLHIESISVSSCIASIVCVPLALKVSNFINNFDISGLIKSWIGGGK